MAPLVGIHHISCEQTLDRRWQAADSSSGEQVQRQNIKACLCALVCARRDMLAICYSVLDTQECVCTIPRHLKANAAAVEQHPERFGVRAARDGRGLAIETVGITPYIRSGLYCSAKAGTSRGELPFVLLKSLKRRLEYQFVLDLIAEWLRVCRLQSPAPLT